MHGLSVKVQSSVIELKNEGPGYLPLCFSGDVSDDWLDTCVISDV